MSCGRSRRSCSRCDLTLSGWHSPPTLTPTGVGHESRSLHPRIDKMSPMRLLAGSRCRRAGTWLHADAQGLVVAVGDCPDSRFASHAGVADSGQDRGDDVVAEGEQGADGAGRGWRDVVAAGPAGFVHELLVVELAQVISRLPDGVAVVAGDLLDPGGMLGDGERAQDWGQGERGGQRDIRLYVLYKRAAGSSARSSRRVHVCASSMHSWGRTGRPR